MNEKSRATKVESFSPGGIALGMVALAWFWQSAAMSGRIYCLVPYNVLELVTAELEPFAASTSALLICGLFLALWLILYTQCDRMAKTDQGQRTPRRAFLIMAVGCLPFVACMFRVLKLPMFEPNMGEAIWACAWTGWSFGELVRVYQATRNETHATAPETAQFSSRAGWIVVGCASMLCGSWWFSQSMYYHQSFMLGFNDFGHFLQRVANTAAGRGWLVETPVLPVFWDHFNPGLIALVPLWKLYPHPSLIFGLQAVSLAGSALLVFALAKRLTHANLAATVMALAWLVQPVVGQMNLAYTYGWHPITFAIPLLLAALVAIIARHYAWAVIATLAAMTLEEGVFVIVALFSATAMWLTVLQRSERRWTNCDARESDAAILGNISPRVWCVVLVVSTIAFWLVYRYSGLAEFQTGRFAALGNTPFEILLSPVLRPLLFWGQLLQLDNVVFLTALLLPCGMGGLVRGWRWLLPTLLPLGVLLVWNHRPAHSLAFQYSSILLPFFWLASIVGSSKPTESLPRSVSALTCGMMLSMYLGQFPFSSATLYDVAAVTYAKDSVWQRQFASEDGAWLHEQLLTIRASGSECLATGRIASHVIGNRDVETVGQYLERRPRLAELPDRFAEPIKHYEWIVLDRREQFQQRSEQTAEVEREALEAGFMISAEQFDLVILRRKAN